MYILLRHIDKITLDMIWSFVNVFMMDKLSNEDKMHIQTLCEQGLGAKAITASYPDKNWSLSTLQTICHQVDEMGSAVTWHADSGRPRSARTAENIAEDGELICSQEDKAGTSKSSHQIARQLDISATSVRRIAKRRSQVASVSTRASSSPVGGRETETTRAFQSSAQTTWLLIKQSGFSLLMRKIYTSILQWTTRMITFGRKEGRRTSTWGVC